LVKERGNRPRGTGVDDWKKSWSVKTKSGEGAGK